jgi:hypothetical protein
MTSRSAFVLVRLRCLVVVGPGGVDAQADELDDAVGRELRFDGQGADEDAGGDEDAVTVAWGRVGRPPVPASATPRLAAGSPAVCRYVRSTISADPAEFCTDSQALWVLCGDA